MDLTPIIFVGGGATVMKRFGQMQQRNVRYIEDIRANAKGFDYLGKIYLKTNFSLFCFIVISPNCIVYFIFFSRYDYTHHSMDRNRAYHALDIIRLSDYNYNIDFVERTVDYGIYVLPRSSGKMGNF